MAKEFYIDLIEAVVLNSSDDELRNIIYSLNSDVAFKLLELLTMYHNNKEYDFGNWGDIRTTS